MYQASIASIVNGFGAETKKKRKILSDPRQFIVYGNA